MKLLTFVSDIVFVLINRFTFFILYKNQDGEKLNLYVILLQCLNKISCFFIEINLFNIF